MKGPGRVAERSPEGLTEVENMDGVVGSTQPELGTRNNIRFHPDRFATSGEMGISRKELIKIIWKI